MCESLVQRKADGALGLQCETRAGGCSGGALCVCALSSRVTGSLLTPDGAVAVQESPARPVAAAGGGTTEAWPDTQQGCAACTLLGSLWQCWGAVLIVPAPR